jgi:hypothetical protein
MRAGGFIRAHLTGRSKNNECSPIIHDYGGLDERLQP